MNLIMRERTTWNRESIKSAAMQRQADPYAMNQDHLSQQPKADKYLTGDPSTFAEDVTEPNTWDKEYAGGTTKRNEIGQPDFRSETFNHAEKTAAEKRALLAKANLCAKTARLMLRGRKFASGDALEAAVEDQAVALMHMPAADLIATADRLANEEEQQGEGQMQQQAVQQEQQQQAQAQGQQDQGQMQQQSAYQQQASKCMEALKQGDAQGFQAALAALVQQATQQQTPEQKLAGAKRADEQQQGQQQTQQAGQQDQQQGQQQTQQAADYDSHKGPAVNPPGYGGYNGPQAPKLANGKRADDQQQGQQQQQQAAQQGQQDQAQMQQQAAPQGQGQQMQQQSDDALIDEMLMGPGGGATQAEMDIEMDAPSMDVGEVVLAHEDEVLKNLFANDESEQAQQAQEQGGQQKQAGMSRTASTRTLGTRPTGGVAKVGGAPAARTGGDVDKLAALWPSAPDVRDAFNMK